MNFISENLCSSKMLMVTLRGDVLNASACISGRLPETFVGVESVFEQMSLTRAKRTFYSHQYLLLQGLLFACNYIKETMCKCWRRRVNTRNGRQ